MSELIQSSLADIIVASLLGSTEGTYYVGSGGTLIDDRTTPVMSSGSSGLSFGMTQLDVANNSAAYDAFSTMLDAAVSASRITSAQAADFLSRADIPGLADSPSAFTSAELNTIQTEVLVPGLSTIETADLNVVHNVMTTVDAAISATNAYWGSESVFSPTNADYVLAVGQLASWANRTGNLDTMQSWLTGGTVSGLTTLDHAPTISDINYYLENQAEFVSNPGEFDNVTANIERGETLIPGAITFPMAEHLLPGIDPAHPLTTQMASAVAQVGSAIAVTDPLVIDLSSGHTGITLTTFSASTTTTFFDVTGNGFAQQTAWTSGNTGFLVEDLNSNGKIDNITEMFGTNGSDGFAQLAALDSNHDLKIDANDTAWSTLQVWVDANGDGVTQSAELHSLSSLGITSIDLAGVSASTSSIDGNAISHTSTVSFSDGSTAAIDDAWLQGSPANSYYNGTYTLDTDTLVMPDLRGFGGVADLTIAMSQDSTLKSMVGDFVSEFQTSGFASTTLDADFANILYEWAGVSSVDPASRGGNIDARQLEFMEHLLGTSFAWAHDPNDTNPNAASAAGIESSWLATSSTFMDQVILQAGGSSLFTNTVQYDPWTGQTVGDTSLSHTAIDALAAVAPTDSTANLAYWIEVGHFIGDVRGFDNVTTTEDGWLNDAVTSTNGSLTWDDVVAQVGGTVTPNYISNSTDYATVSGTDSADSIAIGGSHETVHGNGGNDTINATTGHSNVLYGDAGDDLIYAGNYGDTLYGGDGNDTLYGGSGDDILSGGAGGNMLYGGAGNDTYVYTAGADDYINEQGSGGTDKILMPSGITLSDLTFTRVATDSSDWDDLLITVSGGGTIQIAAQFEGSIYQVESIQFADSTTYDLTSLSGIPYVGTNGDDSISIPYGAGGVTIQALAGNDYINVEDGNNTIDGGAGNDTIYGGYGNDTYIASPGFDTINERGGTDTIQIPVGYSLSDLTFSHVIGATNDLLITIAGLGEIRVANQFYGGGYAVENLHFMGDGTTVDLTAQVVQMVGTSGNDTMYGATSEVGGNQFDSRGGSDTMIGGAGDNTFLIPAGFGNDTVEETSTAGTNSIHFQGVDPSHITMWTDSYGNLHLQDSTNSSYSITIDAGTTGSGTAESKIGTYLSSIVFDDTAHTVWDMTGGLTLTANLGSLYGTPYNDTITGGTSTYAIYGNGGDDTLYAGTGAIALYGGLGNDTYVFAAGFGNATVSELAGQGTDTIHFMGIDPSHIQMWTDTSGYLHLEDSTNPSYNITVYGGTTGSGTHESTVGQYVEQVTFDDTAHTVWDLTGGLNLSGDVGALYGTAFGDTLTAGSSTYAIYGNGGNDTIYAGSGSVGLYGGTGDDTYVFAPGFGNATISENLSEGSDTIHFTGIDPSHIAMWTDTSGYLHLEDTTNPSYNVTVYAGTTGSGTHESTIGQYVEQVTFDDTAHTTWDLTGGLTLTSTSEYQSLYGTANNDTLYDALGNGYLTGNDGADTFLFKAATAFNGNTTINDFNTSQNDKIDISDVLHGHYDPATMAIADFVQLTTSGSNTLLKVDLDGTGTAYSPTTIATIQGVTGLDLSTLISDHHLIVSS